MSIISRLRQLEKASVFKEPPVPWLTYVRDEEATDEDKRREAIADYKAKHPEYAGSKFNFMIAVSEECKLLAEWILSGDWWTFRT